MARETDEEFYRRHPRMPIEERAKIFVPFEPLRGYRELLAERERRAAQETGARPCDPMGDDSRARASLDHGSPAPPRGAQGE